MADESNATVVETTTTAETPAGKKRRTPQPKNVVQDAATEAPAANDAKPMKGRGKRAESPTSPRPVAAAKAKSAARGVGKTGVSPKTTTAPAPVLDDIADLLQLEKENVRLRKALSEKLRSENAELRKRLGDA
ncbi:SyrB-like regulator [Ensifer sp. ENS04]|uniref:SyrB-like regulator n=1 Tax=Ensifer sp. ENS04 TaxID=2769281 RepID=UPI00177DA49E|nr:SyrB-like regulator [Ensifer sp. ENS04]MBD9538952.1 SyrB-like regulator [Ensifer sp. ENS04]